MTQMAHTFNAQFREDEWQALEELAHLRRSSRSEVLRRLVMAAAAQTFNGIPTCANGSPCLAPQLHANSRINQSTLNGPRYTPPTTG